MSSGELKNFGFILCESIITRERIMRRTGLPRKCSFISIRGPITGFILRALFH